MKNKYKIFLISMILIFIPMFSFADEELLVPEYTEEYKAWLNLSDEEKEKYIEPQAFESEESQDDEELLENEVPFSVDTNEVGSVVLPTSYKRNYYGSVNNQGSTNACWCYASATMFNTNYYITNNSKKTFANLYMDYITAKKYNKEGFNRKVDDGGNVQIALAYATNGMGIALESAVPSSSMASSFHVASPTSTVSDYIELDSVADLKQYLYLYGTPVVYTNINNLSYFSSSSRYNNKNLAYCSTSSNLIDHAVALIGWDDNYTNSEMPGRTGAFIALNSYGTAFGNGGLYYIFYNDTIVNNYVTYGATKTVDIDYDNLYQHDPYGPTTDNIGYASGTYITNVYKRKDTAYEEKLTKVSSYFPTTGKVTIYVNSKGSDVSINSADYTMQANISTAGYHTIALSSAVTLSGNKFCVGIKYPGRVSAELATVGGYWCDTVESDPGESYISSNGTNYKDLQTAYANTKIAGTNNYITEINGCIKAYTKRGKEVGNTAELEKYLFDYKYYANHNDDLFLAYGYNETALRNHWNSFGKKEGRQASPIFNAKYYRANNSDLNTVFGANYEGLYNHFINYGYKEYRKSSLEYSGDYYKKNNSDLSGLTAIKLIRHYALYGKNEGRRANSSYDVSEYLFDADAYRTLNSDLAVAFGNNETLLRRHWYEYGKKEGRTASFIFNARYYLNKYSDLKSSFKNNYSAAYNHFVEYGFSEGRTGIDIFSVSYYVKNNTDLSSSYKNNYIGAVKHFKNSGIKEARKTSPDFNVTVYRKKYSDLAKAYGTNYKNYYVHYLLFGKREGRVGI